MKARPSIFFDVTKSASAGHPSGLTRVNARLLEVLGASATPVSWPEWDRAAGESDWFFTAELFSESERPGFQDFLRKRSCRCAAVFYDAIPLKHPRITWPRSVGRHPGYMKTLAAFDRVWAISTASRDELLGYWRWLGVACPPPVEILRLGADADRSPRRGADKGVRPPVVYSAAEYTTGGLTPSLVCIGILEPRKNQSFLLEVCEELWAGGLEFDLHLAGRVNPFFGKPILREIARLRRAGRSLHHHAQAGDAEVAALVSAARATVFPTIAEGSGLPLIESLWRGVPCVGSDLPALRENAAGGGCLLVPAGDRAAWGSALRRILTDDALHARLGSEAISRPLPTWEEAGQALLQALL
jgi:glycosyltransferase involved in cell wall biosynthesis